MKTGPAIADILKKEGVEYLFAYPVNHLIEACAAVDIRPIIVRQERIGLHMADAMSRLTKGRKMGVFCMQSGPGSENAANFRCEVRGIERCVVLADNLVAVLRDVHFHCGKATPRSDVVRAEEIPVVGTLLVGIVDQRCDLLIGDCAVHEEV